MYILDVILAVVGFSFLIFIHELGHFLAAKKIGVKVEAFSLGFGPNIHRKWGDTDYRLSLVPLGGYVKLAGEQRVPGREPEPHDFYGKPPGKRAIVYAAGAGMNIVFAFAAFIVAFGMGVPTIPAVVGGTTPGSPAWHAGLERGDRIVRINQRTGYLDFEDLMMAALLADPEKGIVLGIERDGERLDDVTLYPEYEIEAGMQRVGIEPPADAVVAAVVPVGERDPAREAGLEVGDRFLRAALKPQEGEEPEWVEEITPEEFSDLIDRSAGRAILVEYEREADGEPIRAQAEITPARADPESGLLLGLALSSNVVADLRAESWLAKAGIERGDKLIEFDGKPIEYREALIDAARGAAGREAAVVFERANGGREEARTTVPAAPRIDDVILFESKSTVDYVLPGYPAEKVGVEPGDKLLRYGDTEIGSRRDLLDAVERRGRRGARLEWERDGESMAAEDVKGEPVWQVGVMWRTRQDRPSAGPVAAIQLGVRKATSWVVRIYQTLGAFATQRVASRHLGGPIAIAQITYAAAQHGVPQLVYFLGMISLNLGLINLLPLPVLDGGHLVFAAVEKVQRKPVSERVQVIASYVGLAIILALVLFTTWNDIWRWIQG